MSVGLHLTHGLGSQKKVISLRLDQVILKLTIVSDACDFIRSMGVLLLGTFQCGTPKCNP